MPHLFDAFRLRGVTFRNRIGIAPMCQYSYDDGVSNDWQVIHLGSRAVGGAGLVFAEATAVEARGRISPQDLGIWTDEHIEPLARVVRAIEEHGAVSGIQIAHAGRKASTARPWDGGKPVSDEAGGWPIVGPSELPFADGYRTPQALTVAEIQAMQTSFVDAAKRALEAGFRVLELHGAHGYLIHSFLSPISNQRDDSYGGSSIIAFAF
jgi:2,4-dienoyl-CoA reductase-like NADH-dependent reductase (Old Yellow Enzyme family)